MCFGYFLAKMNCTQNKSNRSWRQSGTITVQKQQFTPLLVQKIVLLLFLL